MEGADDISNFLNYIMLASETRSIYLFTKGCRKTNGLINLLLKQIDNAWLVSEETVVLRRCRGINEYLVYIIK